MNGFLLSQFFADAVLREGSFCLTQFAGSRQAKSLCYVAHEKYLEQAVNNQHVSCIVTTPQLAARVPEDKGVAVSDAPEESFYRLHNRLFLDGQMHPSMDFAIDASARVHPTAVVSDKVWIGKNVVVGPNAIIEPYSHLSDDVWVGPAAIVGASGHYYKRFAKKLFRVEHAGGVWLGEGAQLLAGSIVSKSVHPDFTVVGDETVISINSHVAHGCHIGKRCTLTGYVQVAGYTTIGDDVWVGPSATIGNLRIIGDGARIEIGSVVIQDVKPGERVSGNYSLPHVKHMRDYAARLK